MYLLYLVVYLPVGQLMCLFSFPRKQYAHLSVSLPDVTIVLARVCSAKQDEESDCACRSGVGHSLGCRGQRLCGSSLLAPGGLLELLHQTKEDSLLSTVQGYMRSCSRGGGGGDGRSPGASSENWESLS